LSVAVLRNLQYPIYLLYMCGAMLSGYYVRRVESEALALSEPRMYRLKNDGRRRLGKFAQPHIHVPYSENYFPPPPLPNY